MDVMLFNATREETVRNVTGTFVGDAQTRNALQGVFNTLTTTTHTDMAVQAT